MSTFKNKPFWILCVVCVVWLASKALAAEGITGTWSCVGKDLSEGDMQFTLELKQSGETLSGTIYAEGGSVEITEGKVQGDKFEFLLNAPSAKYTVTGAVNGDTIGGDWKDDQDHKGTWEGKRQN
jgi:hypothetical protein